MGELLRVSGAHWDSEMGAITHMLTEKSRGNAPAILFDDIPGYPKGFRTLYGHFSSIRRVALTLGLPLEYGRKVDVVKMYHDGCGARNCCLRDGSMTGRSWKTSSRAT